MNEQRDRSALLVPVWLERLASWSKGLLLIGAAIGVLFWVALQIRVALVPFLLALIISATLRPIARWLESKRVPSALAAALPIALIGAMIGLAGWFVYGRTRRELRRDEINSEAVRTRIEEWLMGGPLELTRFQIDEAEESVRTWLSTGVGSLGVEQATLAVQLVAGAILTLVLTFFLVKDGPGMWSSIIGRIAPVRADAVRRSGVAVTDTLAAYLRSVAVTGVADALLIGLGLWILGVPLVIPLMILTAFAGLFPLVGGVFAGAAASIVALVTVGPSTAVWVVVLAIVVQQVEGNVLQPMIMARQVSIHPVVVLIALTVGGAVAGLAGAFLAVPIVAASIAAVQMFSNQLEVDTDEPPPGSSVEPATAD